MNDCIFCKIIKGEIPAFKIYESENVIAILDANPVNPGHILLMPKDHYQSLELLPSALWTELALVFPEIGRKIKEKLGVEGYNIFENNGQVAGQVIPHLHFHFVPRRADDGLHHWAGKKYAAGEAEALQVLLTQ